MLLIESLRRRASASPNRTPHFALLDLILSNVRDPASTKAFPLALEILFTVQAYGAPSTRLILREMARSSTGVYPSMESRGLCLEGVPVSTITTAERFGTRLGSPKGSTEVGPVSRSVVSEKPVESPGSCRSVWKMPSPRGRSPHEGEKSSEIPRQKPPI